MSVGSEQPTAVEQTGASRSGVARRVVLVVLNFPVPEDRRVWLQATAARDAGHQVAVVCPALREHLPGTRLVDGIRVVYFRAYEGSGPVGILAEATLGAARARRAVRSVGIGPGDVLQVCTPPDTMWPLLRWARRRGAVTVYDQHDVVPLLAATKASQRPLVPIHALFERLTVRAASTVITAGRLQADRLQKRSGGVVEVVRTAADDTEMRHHAQPVPGRLGYLGVMGSQDGVEGLIRAMAVLRDRGHRNITLDLAGDGPEAIRLADLVVQLGLTENVRMRGWLPAADLESFLGEIDALVVPDPLTPFNHTCPMLKVSHALAQGLPVIMTPLEENLAITGPGPYVTRGDRPEDLADAVEHFLDDSQQARQAEGDRLRTRFDEVLAWPRHRERYLELLASAEPRGASPSPSAR